MLLGLDQSLFHLINQVWANRWFDVIMPLITEQQYWLPVLIPLWFYLLLGRKGSWRRLAVMILIGAGLADTVSSHVIKPMVQRARPCCAEAEKRLLVPCKGSKSFPSSHAANTAAVAGVVWRMAGWQAGLPLLVISMAVSYSRVYVGVHYPLDVSAGMVLGLLLAWLAVYMSDWLVPPKKVPEVVAAKIEETLPPS